MPLVKQNKHNSLIQIVIKKETFFFGVGNHEGNDTDCVRFVNINAYSQNKKKP